MKSDTERVNFLDHAYANKGKVVEILDDGKLWNHNEKPNTGFGEDPESTYAIKDIKKGDEMLDDYGYYESIPWFDKIYTKYGIADDYYVVHKPNENKKSSKPKKESVSPKKKPAEFIKKRDKKAQDKK